MGQRLASRGRAALLALAALSVAAPAYAHDGAGLVGGFLAGFVHPITGVDHLLAMVAVGLWGAFLGRPLLIVLPMLFPMVMALGGVLGMVGAPMPPVEIGVSLSVLVLGGLIAAAARPPTWAACLIVGAFAVFHGYAHGEELPSAADPAGYSIGFVLATGMLHLAGIGMGLLNDRRGGQALTRGIGAAIAAAGAWFLFASLAA